MRNLKKIKKNLLKDRNIKTFLISRYHCIIYQSSLFSVYLSFIYFIPLCTLLCSVWPSLFWPINLAESKYFGNIFLYNHTIFDNNNVHCGRNVLPTPSICLYLRHVSRATKTAAAIDPELRELWAPNKTDKHSCLCPLCHNISPEQSAFLLLPFHYYISIIFEEYRPVLSHPPSAL